MLVGAVAMIDALGFKGIWNRHPPDEVLAKMRELRTELVSWKERHEDAVKTGHAAGIEALKVEFVSDTIAFGVTAETNPKFAHLPDVRAVLSLFQASVLCSLTMRRAVEGRVPLVYRGCIALGEFMFEDGVLLGRAVDEAAEGMDLADGAFVWFAPSARPLADRFVDDAFNSLIRPVQPWDVPLRDGRTYRTHAVLPFNGTDGAPQRKAIAQRVSIAFGETRALGLDIKKVNTLEFLSAALEYYEEKDRAHVATTR